MFRNQFTEDRFVAAVEKFVDAYVTSVNRQTTVAEPQAPRYGHTFDDVKHLVDAGQIIPAIKMFREMTHAGLKDSKDVVDMLRGNFLRSH